jgi:ferrous iron transport protein A
MRSDRVGSADDGSKAEKEKEGRWAMMPLGLLATGEQGEIVEIGGRAPHTCRGPHGTGCAQHCGRIEQMGVRVGKRVEMLSNAGSGPLVVRVDESRIAMGRGMAMKIMVRRKET